MYRLLLPLMLLSGSALAVESAEPTSEGNGCPARIPVEAVAQPVATLPQSGAAALKPGESGGEVDQRPKTRSRSPAWHSFLPGMFK
jgi:hypothetical protein